MASQQTTHVPNDSNVFPRPLACESNGNSGSPPPGEVGAGGAASATPDTGCAIAAEAEAARPPGRRADGSVAGGGGADGGCACGGDAVQAT